MSELENTVLSADSRFAIIENNVVTNIILADQEFIDKLGGTVVNIDDMECSIGDAWNGTSFSKIDPETLEAKRTRIWEDIKKHRDNLVQNGGYKVGAHWYHSDTFSRTQQIALVIMGANLPAGIQWKTMENGYVAMTPTLAGQIFAAAAASDKALFAKAAEHQAALDLSIDPDSYNWRDGWPETYLTQS